MMTIDPASFTPFYEQIKQQLKGQIRTGLLKPEDPLPSIRELAVSLLLNPNTIARAYRELEREGWIVTRKGKGCFVRAGAARGGRAGRRDELERLLDQVAEEARRRELSPEAIQKLLARRVRARRRRQVRQGWEKP